MRSVTRVMLVDDHSLVRAGLRRLLGDAADIRVVAEAESGEAALNAAREHQLDVVLMDIQMPGIGGIEATVRLLHAHPALKVLAVSMFSAEPFPSRMLAAGATGYVTKDCRAEELLAAVREVARGGHYVAAKIASNLAVSLVNGEGRGSPFDQLSPRELQVMLMVTRGLSIQTISNSLHLSPKTVGTYRYRLFEKLGVDNDVGLTRLAMRHGLLSPEDG